MLRGNTGIRPPHVWIELDRFLVLHDGVFAAARGLQFLPLDVGLCRFEAARRERFVRRGSIRRHGRVAQRGADLAGEGADGLEDGALAAGVGLERI